MNDFKPIGTLSNFKKGSWNNVYQNLDVGSYFPGDAGAQGVQIQERFDFKKISLDVEFNQPNKGWSTKKLGEVHNTPLW